MARILLVDDEDTVLETLGVLLRSEGHEVVPIREGSEAYDLLWSAEVFDLLMTDIRMSPVDGMQLMRLAKEIRPAMPLVVVSAYLDEKTIEKVLTLGCSAYVKKPFTIEEVLAAVGKALSLVKDEA